MTIDGDILHQSQAAIRTLKAMHWTWTGELWQPPLNKPVDARPGHAVAAMVVIDTDDQRLLAIDRIDAGTPDGQALMRRLVIEHMPRVVRVVAVMHEEVAVMMFAAHEIASKGLDLDGVLRSMFPHMYRRR